MQNHTKGEWINQGWSEEGILIHSENRPISDGLDSGVAYVFGPNSKEAHANASLIAAAPDMLEALTELVNNYEDQEGIHANNQEVILKAKRAIEKATEQ